MDPMGYGIYKYQETGNIGDMTKNFPPNPRIKLPSCKLT
jgi:hypothetical protein